MSSNDEFFLRAKHCSIDKKNGSLCSSICSEMVILWFLLKFASKGAFELILGWKVDVGG